MRAGLHLGGRAVRLAIATVARFAVGAACATASHWNLAGSNIVHINAGHHPSLGFNNGANENADVQLRFEQARAAWNTSPYLTIYNGGTDVRAWDGWYGAVNWAGLATAGGWDGTHAVYMDVIANLTYMSSPYPTTSWQYKAAVTCHEVGHAVAGVGEQTGPDQSCMAVGYSAPANPPSWDSNAAYRTPSQHDRDHVGHLWHNLH
jgi:hypothetical protein